MADLAQLERALVNADAAGDAAGATVLAAEIQKMRVPRPGGIDTLQTEALATADRYRPQDTIGGMVRGAGSIGATLLRPFESREDNAARRQDMDAGLASSIGADPKSTSYQAGKLGAEVAGTMGVGGMIARGAAAIPGAARALPNLLPAIQSGGMTAGGARGTYGMANRIAGGAVSGGAAAGTLNPENTTEGAAAGALLPPALRALGAAGASAREMFTSKTINPVLANTARESIEAGYVLPPNLVAPSWGRQVMESISGKQATQQIASTRNTATTEKLVRQAIGLADDLPLSKGSLETLRKTAGTAYADVSALGPQAAADLEALKVARNEAQAWFKAYNRSASPVDLGKAKELRTQSQQLETALEQHAADAGRPELIPKLREARKEIAKLYTVERALNDAAGTVDARVLGRMHEKGAPLSDGLDTVGKFASAFPSVAKSPQQVGSPAAHNLKSIAGMLLGGGGYAALGPLGALGAVAPFVMPPVARSVMFSGPAQRGLTGGAQGPRQSLFADPEMELLTQGVYRAGPALIGR